MHERKALMASLSDAFIALPGGFGTFEEFCEVVTWSQLGLHRKPCGLLNVAGYYDPLVALFDRAVADGFIRPENRGIVIAEADPGALDPSGWSRSRSRRPRPRFGRKRPELAPQACFECRRSEDRSEKSGRFTKVDPARSRLFSGLPRGTALALGRARKDQHMTRTSDRHSCHRLLGGWRRRNVSGAPEPDPATATAAEEVQLRRASSAEHGRGRVGGHHRARACRHPPAPAAPARRRPDQPSRRRRRGPQLARRRQHPGRPSRRRLHRRRGPGTEVRGSDCAGGHHATTRPRIQWNLRRRLYRGTRRRRGLGDRAAAGLTSLERAGRKSKTASLRA